MFKTTWRSAWIDSYKTVNGKSYRVRYYDEQGKQKTAGTFPKKPTAEKFKVLFEDHLNDPSKPFPQMGSIVLDSVEDRLGLDWTKKVEEFSEAGSLKLSTRITRKERLTRFGTIMAIEHTGQVTPAIVDQFCRHLRDEKQQKPATIAGYLQTIARFYSWLELESPVDNQIKKDWKPYAKYVKPRPHFYTTAEYRKMLEACDRIGHKELDPEGNKILVIREGERDPLWWKTYISVLYWLGLRLEEVSQLIWADIDLDDGDIKIQEHDRLKGGLTGARKENRFGISRCPTNWFCCSSR